MLINLVKSCNFFYFIDLPACDKKAEVIPVAPALVTQLRSQFNHIFTLLVSMPHFTSIKFH